MGTRPARFTGASPPPRTTCWPRTRAAANDGPDSDTRAYASEIGDGHFPPGTLLAEPYRIVSLVGRGGMGEVYRASDLKLRQPVALKFLPLTAAGDPRVLARFHGEVRLARQISHPNVCRVYDIGDVNGLPYISMEYINGEDLASLLRRIGRLPHDKAIEIARRLCAGLAGAHDKGVVHRDLKPGNVMIDGRGQVFITDFGLAATVRELEHTQVQRYARVHGTGAARRARGHRADDLYALGLVLHEMFTGTRPFTHRREPTDRPPRIESVVKDIDVAVASTIERASNLCQAIDRRLRTQSSTFPALNIERSSRPGDRRSSVFATGKAVRTSCSSIPTGDYIDEGDPPLRVPGDVDISAMGVPHDDASSLNGAIADAGGVHIIHGYGGGLNATTVPDQFWTQIVILPPQQ